MLDGWDYRGSDSGDSGAFRLNFMNTGRLSGYSAISIVCNLASSYYSYTRFMRHLTIPGSGGVIHNFAKTNDRKQNLAR